MTLVEIFNCTANLALFGILLWRRPRLPAFWVWQVASVVAIGVVAYTRDKPCYPGAWWGIAMVLMVLEFAAMIELFNQKFSWVNEGAIALMLLHIIFKCTEHYLWRDSPDFAWEMRHVAMVLNEIIGGYLLLVLFKFPKGDRNGLQEGTKYSQTDEACQNAHHGSRPSAA